MMITKNTPDILRNLADQIDNPTGAKPVSAKILNYLVPTSTEFRHSTAVWTLRLLVEVCEEIERLPETLSKVVPNDQRVAFRKHCEAACKREVDFIIERLKVRSRGGKRSGKRK